MADWMDTDTNNVLNRQWNSSEHILGKLEQIVLTPTSLLIVQQLTKR